MTTYTIFEQLDGVPLCFTRSELLCRLVTRYQRHLDYAPMGRAQTGPQIITVVRPDGWHYHGTSSWKEHPDGTCAGPWVTEPDYGLASELEGLADEGNRPSGWSEVEADPEILRAGEECYYGRCPRCYGEGCPEHAAGYDAVEAEYRAEIRAHDCKAARCGPVCTAFDW